MIDDPMRCLSLKQPFADLLVSGKKMIELRRWNTTFRGEFLVHASRNIDKNACKTMGIDPTWLTTGAVIGKATIYGVKTYASKEEFVVDEALHLATYDSFGSSKYGFLIKDAARFKKPIPAKGKLGFFELDVGITPSSGRG
jgi:hypothetical protein